MKKNLAQLMAVLVFFTSLVQSGARAESSENRGIALKFVQTTIPKKLNNLNIGVTELVSLASDGTQGNGNSDAGNVSADGRYAVFGSDSSNLVPRDTNNFCDANEDGIYIDNCPDVFVHDRWTGQTTRVSVASDGRQGNRASLGGYISADGRFVAFDSDASNLVNNDTNHSLDVFVYDRSTGQTTRVSISSDGTEGDFPSRSVTMSADGRYVTFGSYASNLVSDDTNGQSDVFVHDRQTGQTTRISVASDGTQGNAWADIPSISADGRYVAFQSESSNLVSDDTNGLTDVFIHDQQTGQTTRISLASDGTHGNEDAAVPSISADGRYVAFASMSSNLVINDSNGFWDIFVHDQQTNQTIRVSVNSDGTQGNNDSGFTGIPSISADGRFVAFHSEASNMVDDDTNGRGDVFVHDRQTGQTIRVSVASDGSEQNRYCYGRFISSDGRFITFESNANNLVINDRNRKVDAFVRDVGIVGTLFLPFVVR